MNSIIYVSFHRAENVIGNIVRRPLIFPTCECDYHHTNETNKALNQNANLWLNDNSLVFKWLLINWFKLNEIGLRLSLLDDMEERNNYKSSMCNKKEQLKLSPDVGSSNSLYWAIFRRNSSIDGFSNAPTMALLSSTRGEWICNSLLIVQMNASSSSSHSQVSE